MYPIQAILYTLLYQKFVIFCMALYHTYRPQTFADVLGQEIITTTLSNQILTGRTAHAYLFSGPRGVGKTTTARIIAKALSCTQRTQGSAEPCNACVACVSITEGSAIDIIEIDAASNTGVDHVREVIIESAHTRPTSLVYKIFIIDEVHMLSKSAFNALLKILEEPPKHVVFVLATTEPEKLPDTIISRCQHFHFRNIPDDILRSHVESLATQEGVTIDPSIIDRIVRKSGGCGRDAVRFLDQLLGLGKKDITVSDANTLFPVAAEEWIRSYLSAILAHDAQGAIKRVVEAQEQGQHIKSLMERSLEVLRALLVFSTTNTVPHGELLTETEIKEMLGTVDTVTLLALFDIIADRQRQIDTLPLPSYALELVVYTWMTRGAVPATQTPIGTKEVVTKHVVTPTVVTPASPPVVAPTMETVQTPPPVAMPVVSAMTEPAQPITIVPQDTPQTETHTSGDESVTEDQVRTIWKPFTTYIENNSPSLAFIIHMAQIISVKNGTITISVPYSFHRDKLKQAKSYAVLTSALATLLSVSHVVLDVTIVNTEAAQEESPANMSDLTSAFGGQIVSA